jgi:cation diffusion facilitator family transporter
MSVPLPAGRAEGVQVVLATKESVARLSIFAVSLLIAMKVVASILTGSIAIRADAVHSAIDLSAVVIGYIGIRISSKPPDERHAFGHGKAENIASAVIGSLIFVAAGIIFYQAVKRLTVGAAVELLTVGIYVTAAALAINAVISWYALRVARATDSLALEATARDMFADMLSSCAVLVGLVLVKLTGLSLLDPIVAMLVAVVIARTAYFTLKKSFGGLMDKRLPQVEENEIRNCIMEQGCQLVGFHDLRTRKAGAQRFVDLHLVMPKNASVEEAHRICDHLEQRIKDRLPNTSITIHVEPCSEECSQCSVSCTIRDDSS